MSFQESIELLKAIAANEQDELRKAQLEKLITELETDGERNPHKEVSKKKVFRVAKVVGEHFVEICKTGALVKDIVEEVVKLLH